MPDEPEPTTDDVGALRREAGSRRDEQRQRGEEPDHSQPRYRVEA